PRPDSRSLFARRYSAKLRSIAVLLSRQPEEQRVYRDHRQDRVLPLERPRVAARAQLLEVGVEVRPPLGLQIGVDPVRVRRSFGRSTERLALAINPHHALRRSARTFASTRFASANSSRPNFAASASVAWSSSASHGFA